MDDCYYESLIYITIETEDGRFDGVLNGGTIFLFDRDGAYFSLIEVGAADLAANRPIPVSYNRTNMPSAIVWANHGAATLISIPAEGDTVEDLYVSMTEDTAGYDFPADNLFYGGKQLTGAPVENIVITPKTGRLAITVRGLPAGDPSERYYFTAAAPYDRYDFTGRPLSGEAILNLAAEFRGTDLVTSQAYHLFHFPSPAPEGESLTISLYRAGGGSGADELLAVVSESQDGQPLVIQRERTTNILIEFASIEDFDIQVEITGWSSVSEWNVW